MRSLWNHPIIGFALLTLIFLINPDVAFAQYGSGASASLGETIVKFAGVLSAINTFMHIMLLMVLKMLGYLLQADFFNDAQMMSALNTIWQLSRNIMNVMFALALIGVAFYSIIQANTDELKKRSAHFIMAVIFVNFSWFFPRIIIDVANVMTATVYDIPNALPAFTCEQIDNGTTKPCDVVLDAAFMIDAAEQGNFCSQYGFAAGSPNCPCISGLGCYAKDTWQNAVTTNRMRPAHAMVNGMAVSFAKITNYAQIPNAISNGGTIDPAQVTMQIVMGVLMAFLVQIAMLLPLLGLGVGLFLRIIIMWVCVALMPFTFIGLLVNGKLGTNVFGFEIDVWKEFLNAAFLPAIVGVPITIGFIMLGTVATIPAPGGLGNFNIPLIPGVQGWWPLLWIFVSIAIIWTGSFTALRKSQIVGKVTDKLQGIGQQAFSGAARLPLLAPLPFPGAKNFTAGDVLAGPRKFNDALRIATREGYSAGEFADMLSENLNRAKEGAKNQPKPQYKTSDEIVRAVKGTTDVERNARDSLKRELQNIQQELRNARPGTDRANVFSVQLRQLQDKGMIGGGVTINEFNNMLDKLRDDTDAGPTFRPIVDDIRGLINETQNANPNTP